jgi:hypothetical protein
MKLFHHLNEKCHVLTGKDTNRLRKNGEAQGEVRWG